MTPAVQLHAAPPPATRIHELPLLLQRHARKGVVVHPSQEQRLWHLDDLAVEAELRLKNHVGAQIGTEQARPPKHLRSADAVHRVAEPNVLEQREEAVAGAGVWEVQTFFVFSEPPVL